MVARQLIPEIEPVQSALAQGEYELAFALLETAAQQQRGCAEKSQLELYLAAIYALYGQDGLEGGLRYLKAASESQSVIVQDPLYRALYWRFSAYRGDAIQDVKRGALAAAQSGDAFSAYHAASALVDAGVGNEAVSILERGDMAELPEYLAWRRWSLLGQSYEQHNDWQKAAEAYARAASLSQRAEQQTELLNLAACLLEAGENKQALAVLTSIDELLLDAQTDLTIKNYLEGRVHLQLDNPNTALRQFLQARALEESAGELSFNLSLALGQTYATLERLELAMMAFREAIDNAPLEQRSVALHEASFALFERGRLIEAREMLSEVERDQDYAFRASVYADLAEIEFRLGNIDLAKELACRALDLGAVAAACLCLGNIAYDCYLLDEAVTWFEQAASASSPGEIDWLVAQQMLADTLVQQGYQNPARIIRHAKAALAYLQPREEWAIILRDYVKNAQTRLGGHTKLLN